MTLASRLARTLRHHSQLGQDPVQVKLKSLIDLHRETVGVSLEPGRIRSLESGRYHSTFLGRGMTFAESRLYQPGDDVRHMDWRVTARTGKPYSKLFHEERERTILIWVDFRSSMFFATRGRFKSVQAALAAAWIAWAANRSKDRIGGLLFSEHNRWELRPRSGDKAVLRFLHALCEGATWRRNEGRVSDESAKQIMSQALMRLRRVVKPGSHIFLLSDFHHLDESGESHIKRLSKNNQLTFIFLHDRLEQALPAPGLYPVDLGAGHQLLDTTLKKSRDRYAERFQQRKGHLLTLSRQLRGHFLSLSTEENPLATLKTAFLH